jgi:HTH-type transcriptional regulator / antitoxin HipB
MNSSYPVSTPVQLAATLRALRRSKGLTQAEVGRLLGVSQVRIAKMEKDPDLIGFAQVSRWAAALGGRIEITIISTMEKRASKNPKKTADGW